MGQEMSFVDDQERDAAALAVLGGEQGGGLGGEGGGAVGGPAAERGGHVVVDAPGASGGVSVVAGPSAGGARGGDPLEQVRLGGQVGGGVGGAGAGAGRGQPRGRGQDLADLGGPHWRRLAGHWPSCSPPAGWSWPSPLARAS